MFRFGGPAGVEVDVVLDVALHLEPHGLQDLARAVDGRAQPSPLLTGRKTSTWLV